MAVLSKSSTGYKVIAGKNSLSYSRLRGLLLQAFVPYVEDIRIIGTHSIRSGTTNAVARAVVPNRPFLRVSEDGVWRTSKMDM